MKRRRNARFTRLELDHTTLAKALLACCCALMLGCRKTPSPVAPGPAAQTKVEDRATRELRAIGDKVTTALVARDIDTLLEFDHNSEDRASLKDKSGDLYCYLFDSSCITGAMKTPAVYDLFSAAPKLGIDASVASVDGRTYGMLMFYDKSQISNQELYTPDFLCSDKALKRTASWHFIMDHGKWSTSTLFDYKTDKPCKREAAGE
jgi:hypothetical protein